MPGWDQRSGPMETATPSAKLAPEAVARAADLPPPSESRPSALRAAVPTAPRASSDEQDPAAAWTRELGATSDRELIANSAIRGDARLARELDASQLDALRDWIDRNHLGEDSSPHDLDDGDGRFEPWELGFQLWERGSLVLLALGPDPYSSYGYAIEQVPESSAAFAALEVLDLGQNRLGALPDALAQLPQLRVLRAAHNRIASLPANFGELPRIEILVLSGNPIAALPPSLGGLRDLRELYLANHHLRELPAELVELPQLQVLDVSLSAGSATDPEAGLRTLPPLERASALDSLLVAGNRVCDSGAAAALADAGVPALRGLGQQRCGS